MAYFCVINPVKVTIIFVLATFMIALPVYSIEFDVGGDDGWKVPSSKSPQMYNQWASKNQFQVGDVVKFKYEKDSVMEVTKDEYEMCQSVHPIFFSNNGKTEFKFSDSGTFYFISGVSDHCEKGQKMIIKVMSHSDAPGGSPSPRSPDSPDGGDAGMQLASAPLQVLAMLVVAIFVYGF